MKLDSEDFTNERERKVVVSLITCKEVLTAFAPHWQYDLLESDSSKAVAKICFDYFAEHKEAPNGNMLDLFQAWSVGKNPATVALIDKFLTDINLEHIHEQQQTPSFLIALVNKHIGSVKRKRLASEIRALEEAGQGDKAEDLITAHRKIEMGSGVGSHLLTDRQAQWDTYAKEEVEGLVHFPGGLGEFFGENLERTGLIAFTGPQKSGKSWWLQEVAIQAIKERKRVAFFEVGDMPLKQIRRRFFSRMANWPDRSPGNQWPYTIRIPKTLSAPLKYGEPAVVTFGEKTYEQPMNGNLAAVCCQEIQERIIKSLKSYLYVDYYGPLTIGIKKIESVLDKLAQEDNFVADVVVIDYADNLQSQMRQGEQQRDRIYDTWQRLRAMATKKGEERLVVTATQVNVKGFDRYIMDRTNFSEDNRKMNMVTGMVGINSIKEERALGLCRLNWWQLRSEEFDTNKCCHVAQCLPLGNPAVISYWPYGVIARNMEKERT